MKKNILLITMLVLMNFNLQAKEKFTNQTMANVFELKKNTISNFEFTASNYGINFLDVSKNWASGIWPRGSDNDYFFGGGVWFGCQKFRPLIPSDSGIRQVRKLVAIAYNPNNGRSWFIPGSYNDAINFDSNNIKKNRIYVSTEFNPKTGEAKDNKNGPNWPLWSTSSSSQDLSGVNSTYISDTIKRNTNSNPLGPFIQSDEDIFSIFNDSDLKYYDGGSVARKSQGYPIGLEFKSKILQWKNKDFNDLIILTYNITNTSKDTLFNCFLGGVFDVDMGKISNLSNSVSNDKITYYPIDSTLNLGVSWSNTDQGEKGNGFGYVGISLIESPIINNQRYLVESSNLSDPKDQIGLASCRNWFIADDKLTDDDRYNYLSASIKDGNTGPGDRRMLQSSGPFHLKPNQTARFAFLIAFALPAKKGEADGTFEDMGSNSNPNDSSLISKVKRGKKLYYGKEQINDVETDIDITNQFTLSPNPANELLEIKGIDFLSNKLVQIFSLQGVELKQLPIARFININDLADGIYYIKIGINTQKFIKIRK